jgi:hypothetical protein
MLNKPESCGDTEANFSVDQDLVC